MEIGPLVLEKKIFERFFPNVNTCNKKSIVTTYIHQMLLDTRNKIYGLGVGISIVFEII
jgi:hypothetical protein